MHAIERLRRDHAILRSKLTVLEIALEMGIGAWFVLREICFTLSRQLGDHIAREEELMAAYRHAVPPETSAVLAAEHRDEPRHLQTINRLFISEGADRMSYIRAALKTVIAGLRRHMDEEERQLFPLLERCLGAVTPAPPCAVEEQMSINRIVREHPCTRAVFERHFINMPFEGSYALDEVAWRHGMASHDLLSQLQQAIDVCMPAQPGGSWSKSADASQPSCVPP